MIKHDFLELKAAPSTALIPAALVFLIAMDLSSGETVVATTKPVLEELFVIHLILNR